MRRSLRGLAWTVASVVALALLVLAAVQFMARTEFGMERARRFAAGWLAGHVDGEVTIARFSGGGLLGGVTAHDVAIRGRDGRAFLRADSLYAGYDWLQLVRGRIVIDEVALWGADVRIERLPGDSLWNFQRVFPAGDEGARGPPRLIRFDDVRLHDSHVTVVVADDSRTEGPFVTEEVESGRVRVLRFADIEAWLGPVLLQSPGEPGRRIGIRSLSANAGILKRPARLADAEGTVTLSDSVVSLEFETVEMAESRFSVAGKVVSSARGPAWDLRGEGRAALADFAWVHPRLPRHGDVELDLRVQTLPDGGLSLRSERLVLEAPGAEAEGAFGYVLARTHALRGVDLRIRRAESAWLDSILPAPLGVHGRFSGRFSADGPLNGIRTSGELSLERPGHERAARVGWSGTVAVRPGIVARQLEAELSDVELDLIAGLAPGLRLDGSVSGRATLDGPLQSGLEIRGVLNHHVAAGSSALDGVVTIALGDGGATTSGRVLAEPIQLEALAGLHPDLAWLRGRARGAVAFDTRADSVRVGANLSVGGGRTEFGVVTEFRPDGTVIDGTAAFNRFEPAGVGGPAFAEQVSGGVSFRLLAGGLATLAGSASVEVDSARLNGLPVGRSAALVRFEDGVVVLDSLLARAPGLTARARGRFGLIEGRSGTVNAQVTSASLAPLEGALLGGVEDPTVPRLGGTLDATATAQGSLAGFDLEASGSLARLLWVDRSAAEVAASLSATGLMTPAPEWRLQTRGDSVVALGSTFDSVAIAAAHAGTTTAFDGRAWSDSRRAAKLAGAYRSADSTAASELAIDSLVVGAGAGTWFLARPARIALRDGAARIADLRLVADSGGVARIDGEIALADADAPGARPLDFTFGLDEVAFSMLPRQFRPIGSVSGTANGQLRLTGTAAEPAIEAGFVVTGLTYQGARLERAGVDFRYRDRRLEATLAAAIEGREVLNGSGEVPLDLRLGRVERRVLDQPLTASIQFNGFPAAFAFGLVPGFTNISGGFEGRVRAAGSARDPRLNGALALIGGAATWDATGVRYVDVEGTFQMQEDLKTRVDLTARTVDSRGRAPLGRGGTARVTGSVDLTRTSDPAFDLVLDADRMLATRRREAEIVMTGQLTLGGRYTRPVVGGTLTVDGGNLYLDEVYRQYLIVGLGDPLFFDVVDTTLVSVRRVLPPSENPFLRNLLIEDIRVRVASGSWLRSREMDVEVSGELQVAFDRLRGDLRMSGALNALRGSYRLEYPPFARVFEVRSGQVAFPGTPGIDPSLNIEAVYRARTAGGEPLDIFAVVSGTLQNPRVSLRSDTEPPISESDLASYLFFGLPTYAFNFGSAATGQGGVFGGLGSRALAASGLGYFASGLQTLAQNFGLVDFVGLTAAEAAGPAAGAAGLGGLLAATRIEIGRYMTPRLFVAYTQRLASENRGAGVRLEWRLTPTYTFEAFAEDRFARAPSFTLSQLISARKVYGFFLFREWGY